MFNKKTGNNLIMKIRKFVLVLIMLICLLGLAIPSSVFAAGSDNSGNGNRGGNSGGGGGKVDATPVEIITAEDAVANASELYGNKSNSWQIVSGEYIDNTVNSKLPVHSENNIPPVQVQKNIVPTDNENEFLIYISMNRMISYEELFSHVTIGVTSANGYNPGDIETAGMAGNVSLFHPTNEEPHTTEHAVTITINNGSEHVYTYTGRAYSSSVNCSNGSGFITGLPGEIFEPAASGRPNGLIVSNNLSLGTTDDPKNGAPITMTVDISQFNFNVDTDKVVLKELTDVMGDYVVYDGLVSVNGIDAEEYVKNQLPENIPEYDEETRTLIWNPLEVYVSPTMEYVRSEHKVAGTYKMLYSVGYFENVCQLVYKVHLDVTKEGFNSCGAAMSATSGKTVYNTNGTTELEYYKLTPQYEVVDENSKVQFVSPQVRGLLYNLDLTKTDSKTSEKLEDVDFSLTGESGSGWVSPVPVNIDRSETTNESGYAKFSSQQTEAEGDDSNKVNGNAIPWGTYTLSEDTPPKGYKKTFTDTEYTLCYTTNRSSLTADGNYYKLAAGDGGDNTGIITNEPLPEVTLELKKQAALTEQPLADAGFELYTTQYIQGAKTCEYNDTTYYYKQILTTDANGKASLGGISQKYCYLLMESRAPDGYTVLRDKIPFEYKYDPDSDKSTLTLAESSQDYRADEKSSSNPVVNETIVIDNHEMYELPDTGGMGTYLFSFAGMFSVTIALLSITHIIKSRREENGNMG